jgi:hypothetical protein
MHTELGCAHITPAGGNVFADLGFAPDEAAALKAQSTKIIEAERECCAPGGSPKSSRVAQSKKRRHHPE